MQPDQFPLVSILISAYDQSQTLGRSIQSALDQSYPNLEVVVSDDASEMDITPVFDSFDDSRLVFNINSENVGRNQNYRRLVYELSKGEYLTMLNGDDYYIDPEYIKNAVLLLMQDPNLALVHAYNKVQIVQTGKVVGKKIKHQETKILDGTQFFIQSPYIHTIEHLTAIYSRKLATEINIYRIDSMSQDWEFLLRMILNRKFAIIPTFAGMITRHFSNVSGQVCKEDFQDYDLYIHSIYDYIVSMQLISKEKLDKWKFDMLKRSHIKWLIKIWFIEKNLEKDYIEFLSSNYPIIYKSITKDIRFIFYKIIRNNQFLLYISFKYLLNQEDFIADHMARANNPATK